VALVGDVRPALDSEEIAAGAGELVRLEPDEPPAEVQARHDVGHRERKGEIDCLLVTHRRLVHLVADRQPV